MKGLTDWHAPIDGAVDVAIDSNAIPRIQAPAERHVPHQPVAARLPATLLKLFKALDAVFTAI